MISERLSAPAERRRRDVFNHTQTLNTELSYQIDV